MPVTDSQKIDYIWKKVGYGVAKTDTNSNKYAVNESIASPLLGRGDTIWQLSGDIPATKPASSTDVVEVYAGSTLIECTADTSATTNRTWLTNLQDWIGIEFGSTYLVEVFIHTAGDPSGADDSANKVFITGSGNNDEWYFDYQAGVVNFIGTNLPNGVSFAGKSVYVKGARYIGPKGLPTVPTALSSLTNDTNFITIDDVPTAQGFAIGADDSTLRYVNPGEGIRIIGGTNVTTSSDAEGNITINSTGGGGGSDITKLSELTNDVGFITSTEEYSFKIGADDSTARLVDNGEQINILGGGDITTASDTEGNITISFSQDYDYGSLTNKPTRLSDFTNDVGFITTSEEYSFSVSADDSTARTIDNGEQFGVLGGNNITTTSDAEGNITINNSIERTSDLINDSGFITLADIPASNDSEEYSFKIGADDSTARVVDNGEQINIVGGTNISTTSDAEGNITITNDFTQDFAYSSLTGTPNIPTSLSELTNDAGYITSAEEYSFKVAADDSTERTVDNGEAIQFIGGTNVTTSSDAEGNITITASVPSTTSELTNDSGFITLADLPPSNTDSEEYSFKIGADDSTARLVDNGEQINILGTTGISTTSNAEGDITVAGNIDGLGGVTLGSQNEILIVGTGGNTVTSTSTLTIDDSSNFIGINQTSPATTLHMTGESSQSAQIRMTQHFDGSDGPDIRMFTSRGTEASPTASQAGDNIGRINVEAYDGSSYNNLGTFGFNASTATSSTFDIRTRADGVSGLNERFAITGDGEVRFADAYTFPTADGNANQVLQTDGSGNIDFATIDYANIANTPTIPSATSDLTNDSGFITLADLPPSNTDSEEYSFKIGADDSTARLVDNGEQINILGGTNISTTSDSEGNITITNDFAQDFAYSSLTGAPSIPANVSDLVNDAGYITSAEEYSFSISADDSTARVVDNGEQIKITGGTFITTSSDGEGNITITSTLANLGQLNNDYGYALTSDIPDNVSEFTNDAGYITEVPAGTFLQNSIVGADSTVLVDYENSTINYNVLSNNPTNLSDFTNDEGFLTSSSITLAADDSSSISGDSFQVVGGQSISTSIDASNNIQVALDSGEIRLGTFDAQTISTNSGYLSLRSSSGEIRLPTILSAANRIPFSTNNEGAMSSSSNFTYVDSIAQLSTGNLVLTNNATLGGDLIFEGATEDTFETTITVTDPTADRTITFKDASGTVAFTSDLPTAVSDLTNDTGFITSSSVPTTLSELTNDVGYITSAEEYSFKIAADDSTERTVDNGESIRILGGTNITTSSNAEGDITITNSIVNIGDLANVSSANAGPGQVLTWGGSQWEPQDAAVGGSGGSGTGISVGADDSTLRVINGGESILFLGGARITTASNSEGAITITGEVPAHISETPPSSPEEGELWWESDSGKQYVYYDGYWVESTNQGTPTFSVDYADVANTPDISGFIEYSDLSVVTAGVPTGNGSLAFNQGTGVFTHTPANVRETLGELDNVSNTTPNADQALIWTGSTWAPGDVVQSIGDLNNVSAATPGIGQALVWGGSQWEPQDQSGGGGGGVGGGTGLSVGADDSTLRFIAGGESIKFIGGTNISTSSDAEGNITINNDGTSLTIGENAPSSPNSGELWWESDTGRLYVYYDSYWVQADGNTDHVATDGLISKATLKEITAASTDFTDFQARIAAL